MVEVEKEQLKYMMSDKQINAILIWLCWQQHKKHVKQKNK